MARKVKHKQPPQPQAGDPRFAGTPQQHQQERKQGRKGKRGRGAWS